MKITEHCFVAQGLGYIPPWTVNAGIVKGNTHTLIIDTGPNGFVAETILGYAEALNPSNKIIAINTEKHLDHIGGNSLFIQKGIEVHGHYAINRDPSDLKNEIEEYQNTISNLARRENCEIHLIYANTTVQNPTHKIVDETEINLGGITAIVYFTPGHTDTNLSIFIPEEKVLYCADSLTNGYLPNLEAGNIEDWKVWLNSLEKIESLKPEFIVPGHGAVLQGDSIRQALVRVRGILCESIESGFAPTQKK